jgi:hypothetical protein
MFGNSVYFDEKISDFQLCYGLFSDLNLTLLVTILNWSANGSKTLSLSDQSLKERLLEMSPWRVNG